MPKVRIIEKSVDPARAISDVMRDSCGGIVVFIGTVRELDEGKRVRKIEIEAYDEMAVADMTRIVNEVHAKYELGEIVMVHRVGMLMVGDIIVTIAVSAPHRADAFAACREIIDRMKSSTPIWKREYFEEGASWVEGGTE